MRFKKGQIPWNKGMKGLPPRHTKPHSIEAKLKMSLAKKSKKYPKIAESKRGHKMPLVTRLALKKANTGISRKGWKWSDEQKKNLKGFRGDESNPMWKGGISTYDRKLHLNNRRRVAKLKNGGVHSQKEWDDLKSKCDNKCLDCKKKEPEIKLTRDHIIPLSKGGSDNIENIQPLCKSCNCKKYTKIIKY